jgi:hypothetical protein
MQAEALFEIVSLSDAANTLLPADFQLNSMIKEKAAAFSTEKIAIHRGDLVLDHLLLDDISALVGEEGVNNLLVQGNLTARYIYNESTDGAVHLAVSGNLHVQNMAVGGQVIYVQGNLLVNELCWGDYNHGDLHVRGNATGKVLLLTDEYHFRVDGETLFKQKIDEDRGAIQFDFRLQDTFIPDVLYEPDLSHENGRYHLYRQAAAAYWQEGKGILRQMPALTFPFGNGAINASNIKRLAASVLMPFNDKKYEYWLKDLFFRVVKPDADQAQGYTVYMEKKEQYAVWIELKEEERIEIAGRMMTGEDTQWYFLSEEAPQHFHLLLRNGWQALTYSVTEYEYHWQQLLQTVTVEKAEALLALPVARQYPFYSNENYVWHGDYAYQFRQADDVYNGDTYPPQLVIYWEHPETEGDYASYTFRIEINEQGEKALRPIYRESEQMPSFYIDFTEIEQIYKAIWFFRRIEAVVPLLDSRED